MNIDWKRPDFEKGSDKQQTLDMVELDVIADGFARTKAEAEKFIRQRVPAESYYQKRVMDAIKKRAKEDGLRCVCWKAAAGPYSRGGVSDVLAVVGGVFLAVEVKRPLFGEPSQLQREFVRDVNHSGGVAGFATYPEDLDPLWELVKERAK